MGGGKSMNQTEAESVKGLAKPCNEALGVITERECSVIQLGKEIDAKSK